MHRIVKHPWRHLVPQFFSRVMVAGLACGMCGTAWAQEPDTQPTAPDNGVAAGKIYLQTLLDNVPLELSTNANSATDQFQILMTYKKADRTANFRTMIQRSGDRTSIYITPPNEMMYFYGTDDLSVMVTKEVPGGLVALTGHRFQFEFTDDGKQFNWVMQDSWDFDPILRKSVIKLDLAGIIRGIIPNLRSFAVDNLAGRVGCHTRHVEVRLMVARAADRVPIGVKELFLRLDNGDEMDFIVGGGRDMAKRLFVLDAEDLQTLRLVPRPPLTKEMRLSIPPWFGKDPVEHFGSLRLHTLYTEVGAWGMANHDPDTFARIVMKVIDDPQFLREQKLTKEQREEIARDLESARKAVDQEVDKFKRGEETEKQFVHAVWAIAWQLDPFVRIVDGIQSL